MAPIRESTIQRTDRCPKCGSPDHLVAQPDWCGVFAINIVHRRRCLECDEKYSPPVAPWLAVTAILVGLLAAVGGVVCARGIGEFFPEDTDTALAATQALFYGIGVLGLGFVAKGTQELFKRRSVDHAVVAIISQQKESEAA